MQGVWIQPLVGELRYHTPYGQNTNIKKKQYCNNFNKDLKTIITNINKAIFENVSIHNYSIPRNKLGSPLYVALTTLHAHTVRNTNNTMLLFSC